MRKAWMISGALCLFAIGLPACTDSNVEVLETFEVPQVDDQLLIHGQVCTERQADADFPVKIMFIVDCSGSLQQTDEGDHRVEAVRQVVRRYANHPNVYFDIVKFNGRVTELTGGFVNNLTGNEPEVFGTEGLLEADSMTDYQGALGKAYEALERDINRSTPTELSRTKYVVIFFSDGTPDPVCFGCVTEPQNHPRYMEECHEDLHVVCTLMDDIILDLDYREEGQFSELEGGTDYNHNYQIFQLIEDMMKLKDHFHVGDLRFHTAFLYCRDQYGNPTSALCTAAEEAYNLDPDRGRALLREMARRGNGTFRDFTSGQAINFLNFDYTSVKANYTVKNLVVTNIHALPDIDGYLPDTDADGIDDDSELRNGTDPLMADTDGDGYGDFVEERLRAAGYDPDDASRPDVECPSDGVYFIDEDDDGLMACEEDLFKTSDNSEDTDADGFPDLIEVRFGTDPLRDDVDEDLDSDGRRNGDELLFHSHPGRSDPDLFSDHRYWYEMRSVDSGDEDIECYDFDIRYVTLVTTLDREGPGTRGFNDILIWFAQASYDNPLETGLWQVACVEAQYIEPDYKIPFEGEIFLEVGDFKPLEEVGPSLQGLECVVSDD
ncbi:MAG: VWA domain-containing protein [Deltaproteobacteria bacterium]|nr:VWA domain-containing protein [Deltaproteobacteria bacterium]